MLAVISMTQAVPNLCVSRKLFLKHQVNWNTVLDAIQEPPWHNIYLPDNPVEVLNKLLSLLVGLLLLLLKKVSSARLGESDIPYQSEDPSPTIPTYRQKEEKGKESRKL